MGNSHSKKGPKGGSNQFRDAESLVKEKDEESGKNRVNFQLEISNQSDKKKSSPDDRKLTDQEKAQEKARIIKLYQQIQNDTDLYIEVAGLISLDWYKERILNKIDINKQLGRYLLVVYPKDINKYNNLEELQNDRSY